MPELVLVPVFGKIVMLTAGLDVAVNPKLSVTVAVKLCVPTAGDHDGQVNEVPVTVQVPGPLTTTLVAVSGVPDDRLVKETVPVTWTAVPTVKDCPVVGLVIATVGLTTAKFTVLDVDRTPSLSVAVA